MILLLKQYLSSLKERDELDVVLPDILSEVGYTVISRPKRGTSQFGVDVAAVGPHPETGVRALFLLSIKSGDLTRDEWATGNQALRPSLEDIIEVYIPKHVPKRYANYPIVVALCFGGDIHEGVRSRVDGFIDKNTKVGILEFSEWNGDYIANLIASGLLRENIFPKNLQSSFRKSVALVDEPSVCVEHFWTLLNQLLEDPPKNRMDRLRVARQIYLSTWTIYVWCRDVENLESAYQCSSLAALHVWDLSHGHFSGNSKAAKDLFVVMEKIIQLYRIIATAYIEMHVVPYSGIEDALAVSVPSSSSVDINLKLFEVLGRVALHGHWLMQKKIAMVAGGDSNDLSLVDVELKKCREILCGLINNNPAYFTPLRDDHSIEITTVSLLLAPHSSTTEFAHQWIKEITLSSIFSHRSQGAYPCSLREYSDLATHPQPREGYQEHATIGSVLYPSLGVWLGVYKDEKTFSYLAEFHANDMSHSTWQLWFPDHTTDAHLYRNSKGHGACLTGLNTSNGAQALLEQVEKELDANTTFQELSASSYGLLPLILMACQVYRLPIPPHFWRM